MGLVYGKLNPGLCSTRIRDSVLVIQLLQSAPRLYKLDGPNRLRILTDLPDGDSRIGGLQTLFERLGPAHVG